MQEIDKEDLDKLIALAKKNDSQASLDLGHVYCSGTIADKNYEEAAKWYRQAALNYKFDTINYKEKWESSSIELEHARAVINLYLKWIQRLEPSVKLPNTRPIQISLDDIRDIALEEILEDHSMAVELRYLYETLAGHGVEFFSPGGSFQRWVINLIDKIFNQTHRAFDDILSNIDVHVALDPIADKVQEIYRKRMKEPSEDKT